MFEMLPLAVFSILEEERQFRELCNSLPEKEAKALKEARKKRREEDIAHRRALEIANAGRARNFWGN